MIRQDRILERYLDSRIKQGDTSAMVARKARLISEFVGLQEKLNRTVCKNYIRAHSGEYGFRDLEPVLKEFMDFAFGAAGTAVGSIKTVKALEKLSELKGKNQEETGRFIAWLKEQRDYSRNTVEAYRKAVEQYHEYATELNTESVRGFLQALKEKGQSPKTMNIKLNALTKYAEYRGIPLAVKRQKVIRTLNTENVPTEKEYSVLMEYIRTRSERFYLMMYTLAHTGARVSELLQFKIQDILAGDVILSGKGGKYRRFFFTKENILLAKEYLESHPGTTWLCENRLGEQITSRGISQMMKDYGKRAGVRREICHPHAFRHYFAKSYLKRSKDVVQLAELLGHSSIDTTRIYLQKSLSEQRRDFNKHVDW